MSFEIEKSRLLWNICKVCYLGTRRYIIDTLKDKTFYRDVLRRTTVRITYLAISSSISEAFKQAIKKSLLIVSIVIIVALIIMFPVHELVVCMI